MKKFLIPLLLLFICNVSYAEKVTAQQALQKAQRFMQGKEIVFEVSQKHKTRSSNNDGFYVFNVKDSGGFVIVSSDDRMPEILGYSDHGNINMDSIPSNFRWLLDYYNAVSNDLNNHQIYQKASTRATRNEIKPLMTTKWGQAYPYNAMCPQINGENCLTGCLATSMAQVIYHNRWPESPIEAVGAYTTEKNKIKVSALESTQIAWGFLGNNQIAKLMRYCGQSIQMDYGLDASSGFPDRVPKALIDIFGYSSDVKCVFRENYSDSKWEDLMYNELNSGRLVIYGGTDVNEGGHAFILQGYQSGKFYIDWGWKGGYNGYYTLTNLAASNANFDLSQNAIIGIQPPSGIIGPMKLSDANVLRGEYQNKYLWRESNGNFPSFGIWNIFNCTDKSGSYQIGYGLFDSNGLKQVLVSKTCVLSSSELIYSVQIDLDKNLADGDYNIVPIAREKETDDWMIVKGADENYYNAIINNNFLTVYAFSSVNNLRVQEHQAIQMIDGVLYDIYVEFGNKQALVLPVENGYSGDVFIPDHISYNGEQYYVYEACPTAFDNCPNLTSLSFAMAKGPCIKNCRLLSKLEIREGVKEYVGSIDRCSSLKSIEFPKSCVNIGEETIGKNMSALEKFLFTSPEEIVFARKPQLNSSIKDIYFYSYHPPFIAEGESPYFSPNITIHIPISSLGVYKKSLWKDCNLVEDIPFELNNERISWSYMIHGQSEYGDIGHSFSNKNDREYAIRVPAEMMKPYKGLTITDIQYYAGRNYELFYVQPQYVFITKKGKDYLVKQSVNSVADGWVHVQLSEPLTISGDELFVGLGHYALFGCNIIKIIEPDGLWERDMGSDSHTESGVSPGEWRNTGSHPAFAHPIPIRFSIEGKNIPNDLKLYDIKVVNNNFEMIVYSRSPEIVNSYTIKWTVDGKTSGSQTFASGLLPNTYETIHINIPQGLSGHSHTIKFEVSDINGKPDFVSANSTLSYSFTSESSTYYPRKVVMEEGTGTWCPSSVIGISTIKRLNQLYPDNFISIALHCEANGGNDEMANIENYQDVTNLFSGFPTSVVNRINPMDPTIDVISPYVRQIKDYADAKINVAATLSADESSVIATTETTFGFDEESNEYRIAYVVVEDNVGPYNQRNGLSNATCEEYLSEWFSQSGQVSILHNNVARGIYPETKGLKGSIPTKIKAGETYKYEYTFKLPSNIQDKKNIRIVTLLIDQSTGEIINADQFNFGKSSTGITSLIYEKSKAFDVYSISGQKIKTQVNSLKDLPNGIYIINGRKVIINRL